MTLTSGEADSAPVLVGTVAGGVWQRCRVGCALGRGQKASTHGVSRSSTGGRFSCLPSPHSLAIGYNNGPANDNIGIHLWINGSHVAVSTV